MAAPLANQPIRAAYEDIPVLGECSIAEPTVETRIDFAFRATGKRHDYPDIMAILGKNDRQLLSHYAARCRFRRVYCADKCDFHLDVQRFSRSCGLIVRPRCGLP